MFKKIVCIAVILLAGLSSLCACVEEEEFEIDRVIVYVLEDYATEFANEIFTVEDFEWENIGNIVYEQLYVNRSFITVYLKEHGEKQVLDAVEHFNSLIFVDYAKPSVIWHKA
jgi:hydrogenase maturation factor